MVYDTNTVYNSGSKLSLNLNDYSYISLIDDINYLNGMGRRGTANEFVRYYEQLSILSINLFVKKSTAITANDWFDVFTLTNDKFWFSDFDTPEHQPVGVLGIDNGTMFTGGIASNGDTNKCILLTTMTSGDGHMSYKDIYITDPNYGVVINRCYSVAKK